MTDRERLERLFRAATRVVSEEIEDVVGELSAEQRAEVIGIAAGLVMAVVDIWHPRPDGRSWTVVFEELCAKK
jgi:hypothetical protein